MCPYAFFQCPEGPASDPDTLIEGQTNCLFYRFYDPPGTRGHPGGNPYLNRSRPVLVRMNAEVIPSLFLMRSMATDLPKLATSRIALMISDCMRLQLISLNPNVSPP
ncbi:hypothetical protein AYI70_g3225 [Smittium culicis]|uniref:Uncharacterized protein n=1 Tax=Smittium culicis TaxID=133412 RepID=A0A1R1Y4S1_9FUNG|nr:hypothetical protein AYI70_g3225 [Smittium culicis]